MSFLGGFIMPAIYAMAARRYYAAVRHYPGEQLCSGGRVCQEARMRELLAQYRTPLTIDDVICAPRVATPLGIYDSSPISDGAGASIVSSVAAALDLVSEPGLCLGRWGRSPERVLVSQKHLTLSGAAISAPKAFQEALTEAFRCRCG